MNQMNVECRMSNADWSARIRYAVAAVTFMAAGAGMHAIAMQQKPAPGGYVIEHDADIAVNEPGTHNGGGQTVGYSFFKKVPNLTLVFRKRALKPGSGIGRHEQTEDEIYYVLSGKGSMTLDGKTVEITPGTAVLTRTGSSHSLKQVGDDDLVIMINYEVEPTPAAPVK
jgi:mannose-6-phosphate isomerase-like protein (cupin superfamily)